MSTLFHFRHRAGGLLLHPTSLPGPHGCGDLGSEACRFVDFLVAAGQHWWQMLPVGPTPANGAPYSSDSAFAGNPLLVSLDYLARDGLLRKADLQPASDLCAQRVKYPATIRFRMRRLRLAYAAFLSDGGPATADFRRFLTANADWLTPYAMFRALLRVNGGRPWMEWPRAASPRKPASGEAPWIRSEFGFHLFVQYQFARQWTELKRYANQRGVGLIGDLPIFVSHNSCDVWANPELFDLDPAGRPRTVSGVPPDFFSKTGQLWAHPQYRWEAHRATQFAWWVARFRRLFSLFDAARIDHFLGFNRLWAVPGRARTARRGTWVKVPGVELFATLRRRLGRLEIIAEDLGLLVPEAVALRDRFGFPGMRILQAAFYDDDGSRYHQPHTYPRNCVVYPGTHDNETTVGWFARLRAAHFAQQRRRGPRALGSPTPYERVLRYLGTTGREVHWDFIRLALASPADTAIIPVQDLLGLGNEARMNLPATITGNWQWRLLPGQLTARHACRLRELTDVYGRLACPRRLQAAEA